MAGEQEKLEAEKSKVKDYEELKLSDDFMFGKIMRNPDSCKGMLERLLNIKIAAIEYPEEQKTIDITAESKSVRLDVYVEDKAETVYNVEVQTANTGELPKRSRYYSDLIDLNLIEKGTSYKELNRSFVIFICTFDLFKQKYYRYTFDRLCRENTGIPLNDEATIIFFNTKGETGDISDETKAFLHYVDSSQCEDDFARQLDDEVQKARENKEWRREYVTLSMKYQEKYDAGYDKGHAEGHAEGCSEGDHNACVRTAKKMLALGMDHKLIAEISGLRIEEVEELAQPQPV